MIHMKNTMNQNYKITTKNNKIYKKQRIQPKVNMSKK